MKSLTIRITSGERDGEEFLLTEHKSLSFGRIASNDIVIHDKSVSRVHCRFAYEDGIFTVSDTGSRNGITINGDGRTRSEIRPGDTVTAGRIVFSVRTPESETSRETELPESRGETEEVNVVEIGLSETFTHHPDPSVDEFLKEHSHESAVKTFGWHQVLWYSSLVLVFGALLAYDWLYFITLVNFIFAGFYIVGILYKLATVLFASLRKNEIEITPESLALCSDSELPVYTILLPLYREPQVSKKVLQAVDSLEYPKDKLDVKILLEADDRETLEICRREAPSYCEILVVPDAQPKTKPRACNHGLEYARGKYLVIYDAEDRPDPDQLKKAVIAFRQYENVACFQSKLNYYNQHQNFLTRWFTVEYTAWFDLFLPGLHSQRAPIPLGGTSNHFRTDILREVGGWDPFNVTEDADLGVRLYKRGYQTLILDSTTWEEANCRLMNWIRQRSRWIKGYLQTHLVHLRNPVRTLRELGPFSFLSFFLTVGGMAFMMLLNPVYWIAAGVYGSLVIRDMMEGKHLWEVFSSPGVEQLWMGVTVREDYHAWQMVFLSETDSRAWSIVSVLFFIATIVLLVSNLIFIIINFIAAKRRSLRGMFLNNILSPFYWALISVAAWKGLMQLFYKPFYWEKTVHGYFEEDN